MIEYKTYAPAEVLPESVILPQQTHGTNITEIITGKEELSGIDGIWARKEAGFSLGIKTADCAPMVFWDDEKYGIVHTGWRGLVDGIVEKMCKEFDSKKTHIWVGPLLPIFEIQKDECYELIEQKFGSMFFSEEDVKIFFHFQDALKSIVPNAIFDERSTFDTSGLASWRRDGDEKRNRTVVTVL